MNPGDICDIQALFKEHKIADTDTKTLIPMGAIIGVANGLSYRKNNFGDAPSVALVGTFEAIPADPKADGARSPALFMPQSVQAMLVAALIGDGEAPITKMPKQGERIDINTGKSLKIMFEVSVRRNAAVGGAGYEFICSYAGEPEKIDVLENLRLELAGGAKAMLPTQGKTKAITARKPHNLKKK